MRHTLRLVALAPLALAIPGAAQKTPDTRIDTDAAGTSTSTTPRICSSGKNVYVAWTDDRNGTFDIYFNRSTDGGATWLGSDLRLNTDPAGISQHLTPRISCQGNYVYVVWSDFRNGWDDIYINVSNDAGATWLSTDIRLDTDGLGAASSNGPVICSSGTNVYVAWLDQRNGLLPDVYSNRSLDNGATWLSSDVRVNTTPAGTAFLFSPEISCAGNNVYVVWPDLRAGVPDMYLNYSNDAGATFASSAIRVSTSVTLSPSIQPSIHADGSSCYVTWTDFRNGLDDIYCNYTKDGGATWLSTDIRLDTDMPGAAQSNFSSVRASGNHVYVVWEDWRNGSQACNADVYLNRSTDGGLTWLPTDIKISDQPGSCTTPVDHSPAAARLAISGSGVFVAWADIRNGLRDVYYDRSLDHGATWLANDVRIETDMPGLADSGSANISASGDDVYVVWDDTRNGATDIFFNVPFGLHAYGSGHPGSGGNVPQLSGSGRPTIGDSFELNIANGLGGTAGALLLGSAKTSLPIFGGTLLVLPIGLPTVVLGGTPGAPGAGTGSIPFSLLPRPGLVGVSLFFQVILLDVGASESVSMTNGVELWIG